LQLRPHQRPSPGHFADQFRQEDSHVIEDEFILNRRELVRRFNHISSWCLTTKLPVRIDDGTTIGTAGMSRRANLKELTAPSHPGMGISSALTFLCEHQSTHLKPFPRSLFPPFDALSRTSICAGASAYNPAVPAKNPGSTCVKKPDFYLVKHALSGSPSSVFCPAPLHEGIPTGDTDDPAGLAFALSRHNRAYAALISRMLLTNLGGRLLQKNKALAAATAMRRSHSKTCRWASIGTKRQQVDSVRD
jgi:hypothetical protein